jgi:hypothetical protein
VWSSIRVACSREGNWARHEKESRLASIGFDPQTQIHTAGVAQDMRVSRNGTDVNSTRGFVVRLLRYTY